MDSYIDDRFNEIISILQEKQNNKEKVKNNFEFWEILNVVNSRKNIYIDSLRGDSYIHATVLKEVLCEMFVSVIKATNKTDSSYRMYFVYRNSLYRIDIAENSINDSISVIVEDDSCAIGKYNSNFIVTREDVEKFIESKELPIEIESVRFINRLIEGYTVMNNNIDKRDEEVISYVLNKMLSR